MLALLQSALSRSRDLGMAAQLGLRSALWAFNIGKGAFDELPIKDFLFGYTDRLFEVASRALGSDGMPRLGLLASVRDEARI